MFGPASFHYAVAVFPVPSSCFALRRAERVRLAAPAAERGRLAKAKKNPAGRVVGI